VPQPSPIEIKLFSYWPQSVENRAALRTAIAAVTAVLISFFLHLETPYWSGMTVVVVSNLYTGSIIDKAFLRIIGTVVGALLGFYVAGLVANSFLLYLMSCFLIVTISVYYYNLSAAGYAYLLGGLCAFIVISQIAINPQNSFLVAIWRPVEIGIGVVVSAISAYAIFPNHLKDNIFFQIHAIFDDFSAEFERLLECILSGDLVFSDIAKSNLEIKKKVRKAVELIGAMNHELGVTKERTDELRAFLDTFYNLARQLQYLIITFSQPKDLTAIQHLPLQNIFDAIEHDLRLLQNTFKMQSSVPIDLKTGESIDALEQKIRDEKLSYSVQSDFIFAFIHFLQQINQSYSLMQALLTRSPIPTVQQYQIISREQRLQSDYNLVKQSIKAGLSVILALGFWLLTNWPGGLNGIISSLILSIRKNLFEMKYFSIHRLMGCFLGGGVAILSLIILEMNLYEFIWVLFIFVWGFTYFMFKFPKYAYIGLQANIALIISLAQQGGPPVSLDPPLQRLAGIVIGIVASLLVANLIWRADVWSILNRYLTKLHGYITFNMSQILVVAGDRRSLHDLANIFWVSRGLIESLADEPLNEIKQNKLTQIREKFESLVAMQATLSHISATINLKQALETAHLFLFDAETCQNQLITQYKNHDSEGGLVLSQRFQNLLAHIEENPAYHAISDAHLRNFLAYINALNQLSMRVQ